MLLKNKKRLETLLINSWLQRVGTAGHLDLSKEYSQAEIESFVGSAVSQMGTESNRAIFDILAATETAENIDRVVGALEKQSEDNARYSRAMIFCNVILALATVVLAYLTWILTQGATR